MIAGSSSIFSKCIWNKSGGGGGGGRWLATAFDLAAIQLSMIAPVKNHSRTVASMRETGWEQHKEVRLRCDSTVWSEFAFGPVGHCLLSCNRFFSALMWGLRFPFFWSCVCYYMRFTTLRTRPVNSLCTCTCSSMPGLLSHYRLSSCVSV